MGHDSSCALALNGAIAAALQQERISRRKHDGSHGLTNALPVGPLLASARIHLDDVGTIVSSFQAAAPAADGLGSSYMSPAFSLFDPEDARHLVLSHHLAHAFHTAASSGFESCAVLVCDLGGSTTVDGADYALPFSEWYKQMGSLAPKTAIKTEWLSIYRWEKGKLELLDRDYVIPHSSPNKFIFSPASLYENVCSTLFKGRPAYGELMALASFGDCNRSPISVEDIVEITSGDVRWKNGWQRHVHVDVEEFEHSAAVACVVQSATEQALLEYAKRAMRLANSGNLAVAGGMFLNINSNTKIASHSSCNGFYAPSAPHDAGIALGCSLYGVGTANAQSIKFNEYRNDRLGPSASVQQVATELAQFSHFVTQEPLNLAAMCEVLLRGGIVARCAGRSEFGPRALGGRSLLASPCLASSKDILNEIKGRQPWRPVAPIVLAEQANRFFEGPSDSPFMNLLHWIKDEHVEKLPALLHPDGSTRAQTLERDIDPDLYDLISMFGTRTGYPIVVNTSLNGPNEPMIQTPSEAVKFFLSRPLIDYLMLDNVVVSRNRPWSDSRLLDHHVRLSEAATIVLGRGKSGVFGRLTFEGRQTGMSIRLAGVLLQLDEDAFLRRLVEKVGGLESDDATEVYALLQIGVLILSS